MFWNRFWLKSNIVRVEDLVRFPFPALELSPVGKSTVPKTARIMDTSAMFTPGRVNRNLISPSRTTLVLDLSDEVQKANQMQAGRNLSLRWAFHIQSDRRR